MGIHFQHLKQDVLEDIAQITGSGVCVADFTGDDFPDVLLLDGTLDAEEAIIHCGLFLNDGSGTFERAPDDGHLKCDGLNMGAVAGDFDNDRDLDVYITRLGSDRLYRNDGAGAFEDITATSGIANPDWGTGAAWADYDRDGHLDLFVANYVDFHPRYIPDSHVTSSDRLEPAAFNPYVFPSAADRLFHNNGDGTFTEVTRVSGISDTEGKGLGVVFLDLNGDAWPDLYTVNDVSSNQLFLNQQDGTFVEAASSAGVADPRGGMGASIGDLDGDGRWEIFSTHWQDELNVLYHFVRTMDTPQQSTSPIPLYQDVTVERGLARQGYGYGFTGWGTVFFDADHDGDLDLYWTNGYTSPGEADPGSCVRQPDRFMLFEKGRYVSGSHRLANVPAGAGRGLVAADLDRDGDLDLIRTNNNGPVVVIENQMARGHWFVVRPVDGVVPGCRVRITTEAGPQYRVILAGDSFMSCSPPEAHFGVGAHGRIDEVEVIWPDGTRRTWQDVPANQRLMASKGDAT